MGEYRVVFQGEEYEEDIIVCAADCREAVEKAMDKAFVEDDYMSVNGSQLYFQAYVAPEGGDMFDYDGLWHDERVSLASDLAIFSGRAVRTERGMESTIVERSNFLSGFPVV